MASKKKVPSGNTVAENRKARHNYFIEDSVEAGIELQGTEVKSLRNGKANIQESYATVDAAGDMVLINSYIPEYGFGNRFNHQPRRPRKLLLHRREINKLGGLVQRAGYTLVPLRIYFNDQGRAKLELGIAKGKQAHDKRQSDRDRTWARDKARILRDRG